MIKPPPNSVHPLTRDAWRAWLEENYTRAEGVWFVSYKKGASEQRVSYDEAVEEALCFGWIDSKGNKLDEARSMLWFAPRKPATGWSAPNKRRIEAMIAAGKMTAAGMAKIDAAMQDGSWAKLDAVDALEVPPDLQTALKANPIARQFFEAFPRSAKRAVLAWIVDAKRAETRAARIAESVRLAAENVRAGQGRR